MLFEFENPSHSDLIVIFSHEMIQLNLNFM